MAKNKIHSVLTALPALMLMIGLWHYYRGEQKQTGGEPIISESQTLTGSFEGLSAVKSKKTVGKHYLWFHANGRKRGARINPESVDQLGDLEVGQEVTVFVAPTVSGSKTIWVYKILAGDKIILE